MRDYVVHDFEPATYTSSAPSFSVSEIVFLPPAIGGAGAWDASVVATCSSSNLGTYAIRCTSGSIPLGTCGSHARETTVTAAWNTFAMNTHAVTGGTTITRSMNCEMDGESKAACTDRIATITAGKTSVETLSSHFENAQDYSSAIFTIPLTSGADKSKESCQTTLPFLSSSSHALKAPASSKTVTRAIASPTTASSESTRSTSAAANGTAAAKKSSSGAESKLGMNLGLTGLALLFTLGVALSL
ncbi:Hypothetical protein R9X50_00655300 [Acrodontium crateriforme]|uniref:Uncharacterized protein n=1 Tax=Acrodontium crateriforme TaxID=150365 RepID=A0AAQ3M9D0_9PEZI|nr:Hypothetical protein R9X50_00655300 [Acrodontium crateriforme]